MLDPSCIFRVLIKNSTENYVVAVVYGPPREDYYRFATNLAQEHAGLDYGQYNLSITDLTPNTATGPHAFLIVIMRANKNCEPSVDRTLAQIDATLRDCGGT